MKVRYSSCEKQKENLLFSVGVLAEQRVEKSENLEKYPVIKEN